jgi:hypothetical protein
MRPFLGEFGTMLEKALQYKLECEQDTFDDNTRGEKISWHKPLKSLHANMLISLMGDWTPGWGGGGAHHRGSDLQRVNHAAAGA